MAIEAYKQQQMFFFMYFSLITLAKHKTLDVKMIRFN